MATGITDFYTRSGTSVYRETLAEVFVNEDDTTKKKKKKYLKSSFNDNSKITFPKLPLPSTIKKLKSVARITSFLFRLSYCTSFPGNGFFGVDFLTK